MRRERVVGASCFHVDGSNHREEDPVTTTSWMAEVPSRTDAERKADRDELLRELKTAREELAREVRARNARVHGAGDRSDDA